jgi:hypothetical protein
MPADLTPYLALITSQHRKQPAFIAGLSIVLDGVVDGRDKIETVPALYDLDDAVEQQLDTVGLWVGRDRDLAVPLTDVYFSLDIDGLGLDQGTLQGPFDPTTGLVRLPDDAYRTLLRATIAANQWDGSIPQAYVIWDTLFAATGTSILIQDNGDMSMFFALSGPEPDAVTLALLTGGYLALKPAGVGISAYFVPSVPDTPFFGLDVENDAIAGLDVGALATELSPS